MNRREIIRQIVRLIRDVDSDTALKDIYSILPTLYIATIKPKTGNK